jgi:hypothetical protein
VSVGEADAEARGRSGMIEFGSLSGEEPLVDLKPRESLIIALDYEITGVLRYELSLQRDSLTLN